MEGGGGCMGVVCGGCLCVKKFVCVCVCVCVCVWMCAREKSTLGGSSVPVEEGSLVPHLGTEEGREAWKGGIG